MKRIAALIVLGLFAIGCGGVSKKEAREGWASTNSALVAGEVQLATSSAGQVSVVHSCFGGGTATFDGTWNGTNDDFDFSVAFDSCSYQGTTISGNLDFSLAVDAGQSGASVTYTYVGQLEWSGDVNGSCEIDMFGSASAGVGGASLTHTGSVCGHNADVVF